VGDAGYFIRERRASDSVFRRFKAPTNVAGSADGQWISLVGTALPHVMAGLDQRETMPTKLTHYRRMARDDGRKRYPAVRGL
jgi:hypothetical protein